MLLQKAGADLRNEIAIGNEDIILISVGELNRNKNQEAVIQALAMLKDENIEYKHIKYVVCGRGELKEYLEQLTIKYGLENQVKLLGYRSDITQLLNMADIFVFPSCREGLGMAAVEAMAAGLPCIIGDNRGGRELITDGVNGLLVGSRDYAGLAEAIKTLAGNKQIREFYGRNARKKARGFTSEIVDKYMKEIYVMFEP